jgi:hypothetical protein
MELQTRHSVAVRCKMCADRHPERVPTHLGEVALFRDSYGRVVVRVRAARGARRAGSRSTGLNRQRRDAHDTTASLHCHSCRSTLPLARDRLQAALKGRCSAVLVGADGEMVLTYW